MPRELALSVYGIQKLERGTTHPYRDTALRLPAALKLAPDDAERFQAAVQPMHRRWTARDEPPASRAPDNLPVAMTSFVGRERELIQIPHQLETARLLTLTRVGSSGKSRLALELGRRMAERYRDGVRLLELGQLADASLGPHQLAAVVGVREIANRALSQALADALRA